MPSTADALAYDGKLIAEVGRAIGNAMITRESVTEIAKRALTIAAPVIADHARADERQRIREWLLARECELIHPETAEEVTAVRWRDIADLLNH